MVEERFDVLHAFYHLGFLFRLPNSVVTKAICGNAHRRWAFWLMWQAPTYSMRREF
jgi:hypothetical protein